MSFHSQCSILCFTCSHSTSFYLIPDLFVLIPDLCEQMNSNLEGFKSMEATLKQSDEMLSKFEADVSFCSTAVERGLSEKEELDKKRIEIESACEKLRAVVRPNIPLSVHPSHLTHHLQFFSTSFPTPFWNILAIMRSSRSCGKNV